MASKFKTFPGVAIMQVGPAQGHTFTTMIGGVATIVPLHIDQTTLEQVMEQSKKFKNGVKVKNGHDGKPSDIVGLAKGFSIDGDVLRGDVSVDVGMDDGQAIANAIENTPDAFGLSAYFNGPPEIKGNIAYARCVKLNSVDFECETAATPDGMFRIGTHKFSVDTKTKDMDSSEFAAFKADYEAKCKKMEADIAEMKAASGKSAPGVPPGQTAQMGEIQSVIKAAAIEQQEAFKLAMKTEREEFFKTISTKLGIAAPVAASPGDAPRGGDGNPATANFQELVRITLKNGQAKTEADAVQFCVKNYTKEFAEFRSAQESGQIKLRAL